MRRGASVNGPVPPLLRLSFNASSSPLGKFIQRKLEPSLAHHDLLYGPNAMRIPGMLRACAPVLLFFSNRNAPNCSGRPTPSMLISIIVLFVKEKRFVLRVDFPPKDQRNKHFTHIYDPVRLWSCKRQRSFHSRPGLHGSTRQFQADCSCWNSFDNSTGSLPLEHFSTLVILPGCVQNNALGNLLLMPLRRCLEVVSPSLAEREDSVAHGVGTKSGEVALSASGPKRELGCGRASRCSMA